jgi:hypothetical protein
MELLLGGLVCVVAAFVVAGMGMLVVDPGGSVRRIRGASQAVPPKELLGMTGPAFEPLQLAEPALRWPSQSPWPKTRLPKQPWPSETWEGDFFGRKGGAFESLPSRADEGSDWPDRPVEPEPAPQPQRQQPQQRKKAEKPERPKKPQQRAPEPAKAAPVTAAEPTPEEVLTWVRQLGLAGAVEKVRERTGWDFQSAAQFLAATMRQHREGG